MKNIGYSFWGFLGDRKYDEKGKLLSTPDGNAFYSWSIIKELQNRGNKVYLMNEDRDAAGFALDSSYLFKAFAKEDRLNAYINLLNCNNVEIKDLDYVIIEWRWEIKGRNDLYTKFNSPETYQPDYENMIKLISELNKNKIPFVIFDLDYKLTEEDINNFDIKYVIELGNKWKDKNVKSKQVKIPFDFSHINDFNLLNNGFDKSLVYIGNRYERDWCIDKYIPEDLEDCMIYGNWKEGGRDSESRWKNLKFGKRLQLEEMYDVYSKSIATVLLAKKEYCEMGFMTARIIEAIFYGCVPIFINEFGEEVVKQYAGEYSTLLTVESKEELKNLVLFFKDNVQIRNDVILYLRNHLSFMDCKFFINDVEELLNE